MRDTPAMFIHSLELASVYFTTDNSLSTSSLFHRSQLLMRAQLELFHLKDPETSYFGDIHVGIFRFFSPISCLGTVPLDILGIGFLGKAAGDLILR